MRSAIPAVHRRGHDPVRGDDVAAKVVAGRDAVVESARSSVGKKRVSGGAGFGVVAKSRYWWAMRREIEDSVAMSEMRAASFPAPPMPLTDEGEAAIADGASGRSGGVGDARSEGGGSAGCGGEGGVSEVFCEGVGEGEQMEGDAVRCD